MVLVLRALILILVVFAAAPQRAAAAPLAQSSPPCAQAVATAIGAVGIYSYVWGGKAPPGLDCSGLVYWAYMSAGINPGISTYDQAVAGYPTSCTLADLAGSATTCWAPGDIVLLRYPAGQHVALYAGNGLFVDAFNEPTGIILHAVEDSAFYQRYFWQARRFSEDCVGEDIAIIAPVGTPTGEIGIEAIAGILPTIQLLLPFACGVCEVGQQPLEARPYPTPPGNGAPGSFVLDLARNPLYPFQWLAAYAWNELLLGLACLLIGLLQAALNALALAINVVVVGGGNAFWRLAIFAYFVMRDLLIGIYLQLIMLADLGPLLDSLIVSVASFFALIEQLLAAIWSIILLAVSLILYVAAIVWSAISQLYLGLTTLTTPPQLAAITDSFVWQMMIDVLNGVADSQLGWVWAAFAAITYLAAILWIVDEFATVNQ